MTAVGRPVRVAINVDYYAQVPYNGERYTSVQDSFDEVMDLSVTSTPSQQNRKTRLPFHRKQTTREFSHARVTLTLTS